MLAFQGVTDQREHIALSFGEVEGQQDVLVRLHSECLTGDVFCSLRCDCREQLEKAMACITAHGSGIILYLRQEGRGIGLTNKIRAYELQDTQNLDTNEANQALGFAADERDYHCAAEMLTAMNIKNICLLTNNPAKINQLEAYNITISKRVALETPAHAQNKDYLHTKQHKSGHLLSL